MERYGLTAERPVELRLRAAVAPPLRRFIRNLTVEESLVLDAALDRRSSLQMETKQWCN